MKLKTSKYTEQWIVTAIIGAALGLAGCDKTPESLKHSPVAGQIKAFTAEKEAQAKAAAAADGQAELPAFKSFFSAADRGDWLAVSNAFRDFSKHAPQYSGGGKKDEHLRGVAWEAVKEVRDAYSFFATGQEKFFTSMGKAVIDSIPAGSIYFGGTDAGRFVITALLKSQAQGDPFFVLTQNALADNTYLDYVRSMYKEKIYTLTAEDSATSFNDYLTEAKERLRAGTLKPGENVTESAGRVNVSGQVAVMEINGLLAKVMFDKNPDREFYVEESYALDWMYPYLEPHGLIMKLNRQPLAALPEETVQQDHDYWTKYAAPLIGDWLKDDTSVADVCAFAEKVYVNHDLSSFAGDPAFARSDRAQKTLSKLRASIAGIYLWRLGLWKNSPNVPKTEAERQLMIKEADFALRQAIALCPDSPEAVSCYRDFLVKQQRNSDALLVGETASHVKPRNGQGKTLNRKMTR